MRCLWIARDLPFPLDAGDKVYSANMARSLGESGIYVRFLGFGGSSASASTDWPIDFRVVAGNKRSPLIALLMHAPIAAAIHSTASYRALLEAQWREAWDVVVLDSYGSGWALDACLQMRNHRQGKIPVLVYLSHNHEESVWKTMAQESSVALPKKLALWQNYRKVRALERRLVGAVDLVTTITAEDAHAYAMRVADKRTVVLTPGYSGWIAPDRKIRVDSPCRVVLMGSFRWIVKQENLRRFVELADGPFAKEGIQFDVIGDVPQTLLDQLRPAARATEFHGFVENIAPFFSEATMAVVPELIGGGFKLKILDYIFGRIPVASITAAAAGLPDSIRMNMLCRDDLRQLVDAIIQVIRKPLQLNTMQQQAFAAAQMHFQWRDRGQQLRHAVEGLL
ncbi:MAG TPA: glycosyltransferase [Burkholderiales bacterium]|nr:glycosyltransferase [Burkholderiales bacterium]